MVKYCGYEVGRGKGKITPEEVGRLFNFLHANYSKQELVALTQRQLNKIARENRSEWKLSKVM